MSADTPNAPPGPPPGTPAGTPAGTPTGTPAGTPAGPAAGPVVGPSGGGVPLDTWRRAQNLQVATLAEGAFVGRLEDFQFDLETHRIYGWRLKGAGMFSKHGGVAAEQLTLLGRDLAFVRALDVVEWSGGRLSVVDGRAWASSYRGTQAVTRRGRALGAVQDFVLERGGGQITGLLLHGGLLLPLDGRVHTGPAAVIAESQDVAVEMPEEGGDERGAWWARLTAVVGGRGQRPAAIESADAIDVTDE